MRTDTGKLRATTWGNRFWAHVRRKFFQLHVAAKSALAQTALNLMGSLYARRQMEALPRLHAFHDVLQDRK